MDEIDLSQLPAEELEAEIARRKKAAEDLANNIPDIAKLSTAGSFDDTPGEISDMPDLPQIERPIPDAKEIRQSLIAETMMKLGAPEVDITIGPPKINLAIDLAVREYRAISSGAVHETGIFMTLEKGKASYRMPDEVQEIRKIWRRGIGSHSGTGVDLDPFELAYTYLYVLQAGRFGGLTNYELFRQFQDTAGRLFGSDIAFRYNRATHEMTIFRRVKAEETVLIEAYVKKPEGVLLTDEYARPWLEAWTLAQSKQFMGEVRGKYQTFNGPGGGTTLNAAELKLEAQTEMERLRDDAKKLADGGTPAKFFIG